MSVVTTAAPGPTEKSRTIGIRYAKAGMICIASSTGVIARWKPVGAAREDAEGQPDRERQRDGREA